jgi:hypothetical protein
LEIILSKAGNTLGLKKEGELFTNYLQKIMKKLKGLALDASGMLTREQMKSIGGGVSLDCVGSGAPCPVGFLTCCNGQKLTSGQFGVICTCR